MGLFNRITRKVFFFAAGANVSAVKREYINLKLPCALNAQNFPSLFRLASNMPADMQRNYPKIPAFPNAVSVKFVLHIPTKTVAIGDWHSGHDKVGAEVMPGIPDIKIEESRKVLGGYLTFGASDDRKRSVIYIDGGSGFYGRKDASLMADMIAKFAKENGYKIISRDRWAITDDLIAQVLTLEDKIPQPRS